MIRWLKALLGRRHGKLVAATIVGLIVAGGALAYLLIGGTGSGSANAGTAQSVTISAATPTSQLFPGGSADVAATISNPNKATAHLPSLQLDTSQGTGGFSVDGGHSTCNFSSLTFATQDNGGSGFVVPAKVGAVNGSLTVHLTGAISMTTAAVNACQTATFGVFLKVGP